MRPHSAIGDRTPHDLLGCDFPRVGTDAFETTQFELRQIAAVTLRPSRSPDFTSTAAIDFVHAV